MKQPRDYQAEYARRILRGKQGGLTRAQARGHATSRGTPAVINRTLEDALRSFRETGRLARSASRHHVSAERLREYAKSVNAVRKVEGKWRFLEDTRQRDVPRRLCRARPGGAAGHGRH